MNYQFLTLCCCLALALGCSSSKQTTENPKAATNDSADETAVSIMRGLKEVEGDSLPELGAYLGRKLDAGRVEAAPPDGWVFRPPRSYLALFLTARDQKLPRIILKRSDPETDDIGTLTSANVEAYAKSLAETFDKAERPIAEIRPMIIGGRPCVRYVTFGRDDLGQVETQVLKTVVNGRAYDLELTAYKQTIEKEPPILQHRDHAYAVLAGLKFEDVADDTEKPAPSK